MSKLSDQLIEEEAAGDIYDTEISDDDYGFILGPDGELKSVFLPDAMPFKTPKKVQRILKMFGILDPHQLDDGTLH
jgi:hypothetical protein